MADVENNEVETDYTINHFTQNNPVGEGQGDVPRLLRTVADTLEAMGPLYIADIVFHSPLDEDGEEWPSLTVYFDRQPL